MPIQAEHLWFNGRIVPWKEATVHVMSHALHYGSSVFEGVRAYPSAKGPILFRLYDHIERLFDSAQVLRIPMPYSREAITEAVKQVIQANRFDSAYVRLLAFRGLGDLTLAGLRGPVEMMVGAFPWGTYLGQEGLERGVDVSVSSWGRPSGLTAPASTKSGGNYAASQLVATDAVKNGFAEGISLDPQGNVSSGAGENIFLVIKGELYTPPLSSSILAGITRDSVIRLARRQGFIVHEVALPRSLLYTASEIFLTGTAAEITPVRSVDHQPVGPSRRGPVTEALQRTYFELVKGESPDPDGWLEPVFSLETMTGSSGAW